MNGNQALQKALQKLNINLGCLIAETSIWASPDVCKQLINETGNVVWFPNLRRGRSGEKKGSIIDNIKIDDNTYANYAIKNAVGIKRTGIENYNTCHIWPNTCHNERYHTAIPNLVLIPNSIAGLSDHSEEVKKILQYRSFELYGWYPEEEQKPAKPRNYPTNWQEPSIAPKGGITKQALKEQENETSQDIESDTYLYQENEKIKTAIEKVIRKVPGWLSTKNLSNCNSIILVTFFELLGCRKYVSKSILKEKCNSNILFKGDFDSNFAQMVNFGTKSHGKVFECDKDEVRLWSPIEKFVIKCYNIHVKP